MRHYLWLGIIRISSFIENIPTYSTLGLNIILWFYKKQALPIGRVFYCSFGFSVQQYWFQEIYSLFQNVSAISTFLHGAMSLCLKTFVIGIFNTAIRCCINFRTVSFCSLVNHQSDKGQITSIPTLYLFISVSLPHLDFHACQRISFGSPIL